MSPRASPGGSATKAWPWRAIRALSTLIPLSTMARSSRRKVTRGSLFMLSTVVGPTGAKGTETARYFSASGTPWSAHSTSWSPTSKPSANVPTVWLENAVVLPKA